MSAETLRRAAALMRERVESVVDECGVMTAGDAPWFDATDIYGNGGNGPDPVHAHIASWHPAVALAVADWLDGVALFVEAKDDEEYFDLDGDPIAPEDTHAIGSALAVARAYLGSDQ